jgi:hypothetical protein
LVDITVAILGLMASGRVVQNATLPKMVFLNGCDVYAGDVFASLPEIEWFVGRLRLEGADKVGEVGKVVSRVAGGEHHPALFEVEREAPPQEAIRKVLDIVGRVSIVPDRDRQNPRARHVFQAAVIGLGAVVEQFGGFVVIVWHFHGGQG